MTDLRASQGLGRSSTAAICCVGLALCAWALMPSGSAESATTAPPIEDRHVDEAEAEAPDRPTDRVPITEARLEPWFSADLLKRAAKARESDGIEAEAEVWRDAAAGELEPEAAWRARYRLALLHLEGDRPREALGLLDSLPSDRAELADRVRLERAGALARTDRPDEALRDLRSIDPATPAGVEALLLRIRILLAEDRKAEALTLAKEAARWVDRRDVPEGRRIQWRALLGRSYAAVGQDDKAGEHLERAFREAPTRMPGMDRTLLAQLVDQQNGSVCELELTRAEGYVAIKRDDTASEMLRELDACVTESGLKPLLCRHRLAKGRILYRDRKLTSSIEVLGENMSCGDQQVLGPSMYLLARASQRLDKNEDALAFYLFLADKAPETTLADDALIKAAQLAEDAGDPGKARSYLQASIDEHPDGDMFAEALFRLAWMHWEAGELNDARAAFSRLHRRVAPERDGHLHRAGRYFEARLNEAGNPAGARRDFEELLRAYPATWHGILAFQRIRALAPERAADLQQEFSERRAAVAGAEPGFSVRGELWASAAFQDLLTSYRLGMPDAPRDLLTLARSDDLDLADKAFLAELLRRVDRPDLSHRPFRELVGKGLMGIPEPEHRDAWLHAYPRAYGDIIDELAQDKRFPSLYMQALVREESAFEPEVVSWAGAIGLSQLMWPTAKAVARKHSLPVTREGLRDPRLNLTIGMLYMDGLFRRWNDHPALALASYNAGPGATQRWLSATGADEELDRFVETITYDETRGYVKRVLASYQAYMLLYGDAPPLIELPERAGP